jgi:uncharacterized membrane protein YphA (DoxX/SURF4 family)
MKALLNFAVLGLRFIAGGALAWAGWEKMRAFAWWREQLAKTELMPDELVGPAAAALPGLEIVVGLTLILGWWWRAAFAWGALLYGIFALAMHRMISDGRLETCGCFGPGSDLEITPTAAGLRLFVALTLALALYRDRDPYCLDRLFRD